MDRDRSRGPGRAALAVAVIALAAAVAGTAVAAAPQAGTAAKKATKKKVKKIVRQDLRRRLPAVNMQIRRRVVTSDKIADGAVSADELRDGGVNVRKLGAGSAGGAELRQRVVRSDQLGRLALQRAERPIGSGATGSVLVACRGGERVITGGTEVQPTPDDGSWALIRSGPVGNGWEAAASNAGTDERTLVVRALCLQAG